MSDMECVQSGFLACQLEIHCTIETELTYSE